MSKEKKSFFERLTGSVQENTDYEEGGGYGLSNAASEEKIGFNREENYDTEEGQLAVDVFQGDNEVIIQSIVAGVKPDDLDISINKDSVTIRGKRESNRLVEKENAVCQELYWGGFSRTISLSDEIDSENAEASTKNGILTIRLPLARKIQTKKIRVQEE